MKRRKRRYLKKWVEILLVFILIIAFLVLGSETDEYFVTSKIISMIIISISSYLLINYKK